MRWNLKEGGGKCPLFLLCQKNGKGQLITSAWLCDDAVTANGQQVNLKFSQKHDGTFGAVVNPDGIAKLKWT